MEHILEMIMMICFGVSWPINIVKLWRAKSAKNTSILFYFCILVGYIMGLLSKVIRMQGGLHTPWYVWFFYILNASMVTVGIVIWFRNLSLDKR